MPIIVVYLFYEQMLKTNILKLTKFVSFNRRANMPRGDGTGPMGTWTNCSGRPALGRGAGRALGAGFGRGSGMGRGIARGRAMGYGAGYGMGAGYANSTAYSVADEKAFLEDQARVLESELAAIKSQLAASESTDDESGTNK